MGVVGLYARVRSGLAPCRRWLRVARHERRRSRTERRLRTDDTARGVRAVSNDVRGDNARANYRWVRRAQALRGILFVYVAVGDVRVRSDRALGLGARRLACESRRARFCRWY